MADAAPNVSAAAQPPPSNSAPSHAATMHLNGSAPRKALPASNGGSPAGNGSPVKAADSPGSGSGRRRLSPEIELAPLDPPAPATPTLPQEASDFR